MGSAGCERRLAVFALWSSLKVQYGNMDVSNLWTSPAAQPRGDRAGARSRTVCPRRAIDRPVHGSWLEQRGWSRRLRRRRVRSCGAASSHLYVFSLPEQYDDQMRCAEREHPTFVLVTLGFFQRYGDLPGVERLQGGSQRRLPQRGTMSWWSASIRASRCGSAARHERPRADSRPPRRWSSGAALGAHHGASLRNRSST